MVWGDLANVAAKHGAVAIKNWLNTRKYSKAARFRAPTRSAAMRKGPMRPFAKRRGKRTIRRKKGAKKTSARKRGTFQKRVLNALAVDQYITYYFTATYQGSAATTSGPVPLWFTMGSQNKTLVYTGTWGGTLTVDNMLRIAETIDVGGAVGGLNMQFELRKLMVLYTYMNMSNSQANMEFYYCIARKDIPGSTPYSDIIQTLFDGWAETGVNATSLSAIQYQLTPFMSKLFCQTYKIYKRQSWKLLPGEQKTIMLSSKKPRIIRPAQYIAPTDQLTNWLTAPQGFVQLKGNRFIICRLSGQLAETAATGGSTTFTNPKIVTTTKYRYDFKYSSPINTNTTINPALGFSAATGTDTVILEETGVSATESNL